jgi:hypothetical protein
MRLRIYIPRDSAAVACGADDVVRSIEALARKQKVDIAIVRNGSRGLHWLEPMLEVETTRGRVAYGPVGEGDVESVLAAMRADGADHPLCHGVTDDARSPSDRKRLSRRSSSPACAAAAAPASRPASSGRRWRRPSPPRNTSSAMPTRATAALSPTA